MSTISSYAFQPSESRTKSAWISKWSQGGSASASVSLTGHGRHQLIRWPVRGDGQMHQTSGWNIGGCALLIGSLACFLPAPVDDTTL